MRKLAIGIFGAAAVFAVATPAAAQNYGWPTHHGEEHEQLNDRHADTHDQLEDEHAEAHAWGLSRGEDRRLHHELSHEHRANDRELRWEHRQHDRRDRQYRYNRYSNNGQSGYFGY